MRILFFAKDAPFVQSGYGKCCREICTRLRRFGHDVAVFATVGNRTSSFFEWQGLKIYPPLDDIYGEDIILDHYLNWKAELLITQLDVWAMQKIHTYAQQNLINWLAYVPIDSDPPSSAIIDRLKCATGIVAMCHWAKKKLTEYGLESTVIHHGVDTKVYRVLPHKDKLKQELGFPPGCYLVGMVQANQFLRKAHEEQFRAVALFRQLHPQIDIRLYCHSIPRPDSYHLPSLAEHLGISDIVRFPNDYLTVKGFSEEQMGRIYNAFDVLLSATNGEGFGLPVIEAQACGIPVVATDCMSFPELVTFGQLCKVKAWITAQTLQRKTIPDENDIAAKLWQSFNTEWNTREISEHAHYLWNWDDRIIQEWMWLLDRMKDKIVNECLDIPKPSRWAKEKARKEIRCGF